MVAPLVEVMATDWAVEYVPGPGFKTGAATCCGVLPPPQSVMPSLPMRAS